MSNVIQVLDYGFVELVDNLGNDLTVCNSARVSFGKRKDSFDDSDKKLINYLAKHEHWSPFRHVQLQFHCKVPEFIARQWWKHVVGTAYTAGGGAHTVDSAWNEISMRYVDASDFDFYCPTEFRKQSADNKQASTDETINPLLSMDYDWHDKASDIVKMHCEKAVWIYKEMVAQGIAKEQARGVLPLTVYTEFYWTASLQAVINFVKLRQHSGAQYEIRLYADALKQLAENVAPVSVGALLG